MYTECLSTLCHLLEKTFWVEDILSRFPGLIFFLVYLKLTLLSLRHLHGQANARSFGSSYLEVLIFQLPTLSYSHSKCFLDGCLNLMHSKKQLIKKQK